MTTHHVASHLRFNHRAIRVAALAGLLGLIGVLTMTVSADSSAQPAPKPTIVFVHGAFADASGWNGAIEHLQREGYPTLALANPLRGLASDSAYIASALASIPGPLVLVGHSYGGAVITNAAAGNANVRALVYAAAYIPDVGENLLTLTGRFPGSQLDPESTLIVREYPLPDGGVGHDAYIKPELFRGIFAADLPEKDTALLAATQRPLEAGSLLTPSPAAAWTSIPAYCLVATEDVTIGTANVRAMAQRACPAGNIVEEKASHAVMISRPAAVADLILRAARGAR